MQQGNPENMIGSRLCYERVKMREQTKHYQRLLEVKATIDNGRSSQHIHSSASKINTLPSVSQQRKAVAVIDTRGDLSTVTKRRNETIFDHSPMAIISTNASQILVPQSKKDRLVLERDMEINKGNQYMLRRLIEIDMNHSDLNKKRLEPVAFKVRRSLNRRKTQAHKIMLCLHPQLSMNKRSHVDELREIAHGNMIMMKKLQEVRPSYDVRRIESEQKQQQKLSQQISRNAARFIKHPFFITDNPSQTLYRNLLDTGVGSSHKQKTVRDQFSSIMNGTSYQNLDGSRTQVSHSRNNLENPSRALTSINFNQSQSEYGQLAQTFYNQKQSKVGPPEVLQSYDNFAKNDLKLEKSRGRKGRKKQAHQIRGATQFGSETRDSLGVIAGETKSTQNFFQTINDQGEPSTHLRYENQQIEDEEAQLFDENSSNFRDSTAQSFLQAPFPEHQTAKKLTPLKHQ